MLTLKPATPRNITLFTTLRCNASCENCCNGCRPHRGAAMTYGQMKRYVDKCLAVYGNTIKTLNLTGGECMLLGKDLEKIIAYGTKRGLNVCILSNCFWATSYKTAYETLERLKNLGLRTVCFSSGDDHQKWVPLKNARNAAVAAARLGLNTELRIEVHCYHASSRPKLEADKAFMRLVNSRKIDLAYITWMDFSNETDNVIKGKNRWCPQREERPCDCLFRSIVISPYGDVYSCAGLSVLRNPYMRLGNIEHEDISEIYRRNFRDMLKIWLHTRGPINILKYVHDNSSLWLRWFGNHNCDACRTIFSDAKIMNFLRDTSVKWAYTATSRYCML